MKLKVEPVKTIKGSVKISGSKNATLPLMVCSMLTNEEVILNNVPNITDVMIMKDILIDVGINCKYFENEKRMVLKKEKIKPFKSMTNINKIRASLYVIGGLVANRKNFITTYPGGCSFSDRPINYHLDAFNLVGYKIIIKDNNLKFIKKRQNRKKLIINMYQKSVGTTINILFICVLRKGLTIIKNPSLEPEVLEVIKMLKSMNANITIDNDVIIIKGVNKLKGVSFTVMSDRIEAGSYMLLASTVDRSNVIIENINSTYLTEVINTIKELGVYVKSNKNCIHIIKSYPTKGINKIASDYPMFPTDLQQILCVTCTKCVTSSIIKDLIYPRRLTHVDELKKCNANIFTKKDSIYITPSKLINNTLFAHDLRCGFACIVIGCITDKETIIDNIDVVFRGYEDLINKLASVGVEAKQVE